MEQSTNTFKSGGRMNIKQSVYWIIYILIMAGIVVAMTILG
jgi:hypothetical protein